MTSPPPTKVANKLFYATIKPIMLFNSEVWGADIPTPMVTATQNNLLQNEQKKILHYLNACPYKQLHFKFCKRLLGVKNTTSNIASRAELG